MIMKACFVTHLATARFSAIFTAMPAVVMVTLAGVGVMAACKPSAGADLSVPQLHDVVAREQPTLTPCYQRALDQKPYKQDIQMQAIIHVRKTGHVAKVSVGDEGLPGMKACVEKAIMSWQFPEAAKDTHASLPIVFRPEPKKL
jgi:hypothetical protein